MCRNARCTSFLFITIQICSFSLSCDLLKISLIYAAGGENKTFIGSADWMPRNLDNRVEVITPVYDSRIKEDLWKVIDFGLRGNVRVALSTEAVRTAFGQRIPKNLFARKKNYISITNHI